MMQPRGYEGGSMKVLIPTPLRSYTKQREVDAAGATIADVLADLDHRYPGLRFRMIDEQDKMRPHIRFFVNGEQVFDMGRPLVPTDAIQIVQALSGG
jgi:sulfur-carrier protein